MSPQTVGGQVSRFLLHNPRLIAPFFEMLRRHTSTDLLQGVIRHVYEGRAVDEHCAADPQVLAHLVADVQGLVARTSAGVVAEHLAYAEGWRSPAGLFDHRWTVVYCDTLWTEAELATWRAACASCVPLAGAGLLAHFTHVEELIALI